MEYGKMKVDELRNLAKEIGILDPMSFKKAELVKILSDIEEKKSGDKKETVKSDTEKVETEVSVKPEETEEADKTIKILKSEEMTEPVKTVKTGPENGYKRTSQRINPERRENTERRENIERRENTERRENPERRENTEKRENQERTGNQERRENPERRENTERRENQERTSNQENQKSQGERTVAVYDGQEYNPELRSGVDAHGILEVMNEGFGFIRSDNYMPGDRDIYISPYQIRKYGLRTGDIVKGPIRTKTQANEKFSALLYIESVNGELPTVISKRKNFEDMTPIFPNERIKLDYDNAPRSLRIVDLFSPVGKGQRGMIVSPPKAGKTTLLKQIAQRISTAYKDMHLLVLLIDERPEEVTDIKEAIEGPNVEVIYSTFDELPEHHKRVSEMVIERAKRLVESKKDVVILIDSITRLARAYNLTVTASGRTLSGGLDPAALHMPKKFFGAARNMREGGSLTILATALVETGSRMDDVVFEEFKGTGNMELVLNRNLSEKRIFPAIDIAKSGTRKDDLLLTKDELEALDLIHSAFRSSKNDDVTEEIIKLFSRTKNNREFVEYARKMFSRN